MNNRSVKKTISKKSKQKLEGIKKRLANLCPAKKGEVRNPKGRPKNELSLTNLLRQKINEPCPLKKKNGEPMFPGLTWGQAVVMATLMNAINGNAVAVNQIWDRMDGKIAQPLVGEDGKNLTVIISGDYNPSIKKSESTGKGNDNRSE